MTKISSTIDAQGHFATQAVTQILGRNALLVFKQKDRDVLIVVPEWWQISPYI
jgi:hypothetical protein